MSGARSASAAALAAVALAGALAGCGTPSPDLFVVQRSGSVPGADLHLLVSDTSVRCNRGEGQPLSSAQILEARDLESELIELQAGDAPPPRSPPAQVFSFAVRAQEGTLRFADTAQRPPVLPRIARFTRRMAIDVCGLRR